MWQLVCLMQVMWPLPMHLVGYLYEDYQDTQSLEHKDENKGLGGTCSSVAQSVSTH
jgi:hypothetical protein